MSIKDLLEQCIPAPTEMERPLYERALIVAYERCLAESLRECRNDEGSVLDAAAQADATWVAACHAHEAAAHFLEALRRNKWDCDEEEAEEVQK